MNSEERLANLEKRIALLEKRTVTTFVCPVYKAPNAHELNDIGQCFSCDATWFEFVRGVAAECEECHEKTRLCIIKYQNNTFHIGCRKCGAKIVPNK